MKGEGEGSGQKGKGVVVGGKVVGFDGGRLRGETGRSWGRIQYHVDQRLARMVRLRVPGVSPLIRMEAPEQSNEGGGAGRDLSLKPISRSSAVHVMPLNRGSDHGVKIASQHVVRVRHKQA